VSNKTLVITYSNCLTFRNNLVLAGNTVMTLSSNNLFSRFSLTWLGEPGSPLRGTFTNEVSVFGNTTIDAKPSGPMPWMGGIGVWGELVCGGVLAVTTNSGFTPGYGDTFQLFDARRLSGSFANVNLPELGAGLEWDTNRLTVDGSIRVTHVPFQISAVTSVSGGLVVRFPTTPGLYYVLESAPSLQALTDWTPQATNRGTGGLLTLRPPENPAQRQLFFRIRASPQTGEGIIPPLATNSVPGGGITVGLPVSLDPP
jgi:hypothetical protein